MREDFLEPLPDVQTTVTLVMGTTISRCYVVEMTSDGFRVAVPGASHYEGDPRMMLVIKDTHYPVRLTRQIPHAGGFSYALRRIKDFDETSAEPVRTAWDGLFASRRFAAAIAALCASCFCIAAFCDRVPLLNVSRLRETSLAWLNPSGAHGDAVSKPSTGNHSNSANKRSRRNNSDRLADSESRADGMISCASLSATVETSTATSIRRSVAANGESGDSRDRTRSAESQQANRSDNNTARARLLLLKAGLVGRTQSVNATSVPWLFEADQFPRNIPLWMSDAAWADLTQFKHGLDGFPQQTSADAIASLRQALMSIVSGEATVRPIPEMRDVSMVACDDANVCFRIYQQRIELVRILPIEE